MVVKPFALIINLWDTIKIVILRKRFKQISNGYALFVRPPIKSFNTPSIVKHILTILIQVTSHNYIYIALHIRIHSGLSFTVLLCSQVTTILLRRHAPSEKYILCSTLLKVHVTLWMEQYFSSLELNAVNASCRPQTPRPVQHLWWAALAERN